MDIELNENKVSLASQWSWRFALAELDKSQPDELKVGLGLFWLLKETKEYVETFDRMRSITSFISPFRYGRWPFRPPTGRKELMDLILLNEHALKFYDNLNKYFEQLLVNFDFNLFGGCPPKSPRTKI